MVRSWLRRVGGACPGAVEAQHLREDQPARSIRSPSVPRADLAVLDTDVLAVGYASPSRFPIADAAVELTVASGRVVHERHP